MKKDINQVLANYVNCQLPINHLYFANKAEAQPLGAYQTEVPKIEIILAGELLLVWADNDGNRIEKTLSTDDLLYITAHSWYQPLKASGVTSLSILYDKQQICLSLTHWDNTHAVPSNQITVPRRGPRVGTFIMHALAELTWHNQPSVQNQTAYFLIQSLLSDTYDLLNVDVKTNSKTTSLFQAIRGYIDSHFREDISRDVLANLFYISPNYLSHLFQREGKMGLNKYLNYIRLEYAKSLLKEYDLNIKEVALASGFKDSNYFCRIFRKQTERSPTEYRRQYHSKLLQK